MAPISCELQHIPCHKCTCTGFEKLIVDTIVLTQRVDFTVALPCLEKNLFHQLHASKGCVICANFGPWALGMDHCVAGKNPFQQ